MKKKVKICKNQQCTARVNSGDAVICAGCGSSFRGISMQILSDEQIEKILNPEPENTPEPEAPQEENVLPTARTEYIICPNCGERLQYSVGLEFCDKCNEYVADELPQCEADEQLPEEAAMPCQGVKVLQSLDGRCRLELSGDWIKIGRNATGKEYFENAGKRKVSREHAILQFKDGGWQISYCKREDRNYSGGVENPIFINKRRLEREENYRLQPGDEIGFAEFDTSDCMAAFFRAE